MKHISIFLAFILSANMVAQQTDSIKPFTLSSAERVLNSDRQLVIGGYGEAHYNQAFSSKTFNNGMLDMHRMVMLFGYHFTDNLQFISELEFEHVKEAEVEQAYLQYSINNQLNIRSGILLVPMGIINEYHEPTSFNGVERPIIDEIIAPSTWREIGIGLNGYIIDASIKYQAYVMNGFVSYKDKGQLDGKNGLSESKQEAEESIISSPNFCGKVEFYGIRNLNIGLAGYFGKTQTSLFDGINKNDKAAVTMADSSVVGVSMIGLDTRYNFHGLLLKSQFYYTKLSNTEQYNKFTVNNDLGSAITGYYVEAGYNILKYFSAKNLEIVLFLRYETYNMHFATAGTLIKNDIYNNRIITTGLTFKIAKGVVVKTDLQFAKSKADSEYKKIFNGGIGFMF